VALLGIAAMLGVSAMMRTMPRATKVSLRQRLAPLRDVSISLTLLTSLFAFGGFLMVYTYAGLVLDRVTGGDGRVLAGMLLFWGIAGTVGNLWCGRLVDRFSSREIVAAGLILAILNFCAMPWTSTHPVAALISLVIWGVCGWGLIVPQQHRLVEIAPHAAPLVLALNNTATYSGLACSAVLGGITLLVINPHYLSIVGAGLIVVALGFSQAASRYARTPDGHATDQRTTVA
jgi:predicted MFS family arabinose efflux permease